MNRRICRAAIGWRRIAVWLLPALTACAPLEPPPSPPPAAPSLSAVEYAHVVHFATDRAELTASEHRALASFLSSLPRDGRLAARVVGHADRQAGDAYNLDLSARRVAAVAAALRAAGLSAVSVTATALGETMATAPLGDSTGLARDRQVEVLITGAEVVLPGCPDWSRDPAYDPLNLALSNLGCANAFNLGLMVADPRDLAIGTSTTPADGVREAEAILRYRTDKVKQLEADIIQ